MATMKKGYEWLNELSPENQVLFCKNLINVKKIKISEYLLDDFDEFGRFIDSAFVWSYTPEGHDYWSDIHFKRKP